MYTRQDPMVPMVPWPKPMLASWMPKSLVNSSSRTVFTSTPKSACFLDDSLFENIDLDRFTMVHMNRHYTMTLNHFATESTEWFLGHDPVNATNSNQTAPPLFSANGGDRARRCLRPRGHQRLSTWYFDICLASRCHWKESQVAKDQTIASSMMSCTHTQNTTVCCIKQARYYNQLSVFHVVVSTQTHQIHTAATYPKIWRNHPGLLLPPMLFFLSYYVSLSF